MSKETAEPPRRRYRVGVRLPEWAVGFAFRLFEGLLDFQRSGHPLELHFDQPSGGDLPSAPVDEHWEGDGLLVYRYTAREAACWRSRSISVVNLSAEYPGERPEFPRVTLDNDGIGQLAVEHLEALGLRHFAYVHESTRTYSTERLVAFREAVARVGGTFHQIDVPASSWALDERPQRIEKAMWVPLASLPKPCGILTKDDIAAVWTTRLLQKLGIRCPEEIAVLGIDDDMVFCHMTHPPLSSVPYPARTIALTAVRLMVRMIEGEVFAPDHRVRVPPGPIAARESTRHVVLADEVVTRALEVIREQVMDGPVRVAELSRRVGVSRESLRQRFHDVLGRSPKAEVERLRLRHLSEQLRMTDLTLEALAERCGFSGPDEICRFVKRMTGKTPGELRRGGHDG